MRYGRVVNNGEGRTLNLSSGGALIECDVALPKGLEIELSIAWPAMLDGNVALSLVTVGNIVRNTVTRTAVAFSQHYFRTRSPLALVHSADELHRGQASRTLFPRLCVEWQGQETHPVETDTRGQAD